MHLTKPGKDREKLDTALDVLDCMISEEGQKLIADGSGVISLNTDVPTMMQDVPGLEEEINHNAVYIRYSAQNHLMQVLRLFTDYCQGKWMKHRLMILSQCNES